MPRMSKAFVKEDGPEEEAEPEAPALPPSGKNYITPPGYARLEAELRKLVEVERPEVVKTVAWAASLGDRSENADYIYGKRAARMTTCWRTRASRPACRSRAWRPTC